MRLSLQKEHSRDSDVFGVSEEAVVVFPADGLTVAVAVFANS